MNVNMNINVESHFKKQMSIYNFHPNKSLKRLNEPNLKTAHIVPQPVSQMGRMSAVNLSKLGTYKGKFSLTSKYNSLSSQNNHQSKHQSNQNYDTGHYMSENNKENIPIRANIISDHNFQKKEKQMNRTENINFPSSFYDHQKAMKVNLFGKSKEKAQQAKYSVKKIKTEPSIEQESEQTENMKKILMAASSFNQKNSQLSKNTQLSKSIPLCKDQMKTDQQKNKMNVNSKNEIGCKQKIKPKGKSQKSINSPTKAERRSKFHKYDKSTDENEFLVIEDEIKAVPLKKDSIEKRRPINQVQTKKVHTQTIRLSDININKVNEVQKQLQGYKQSIKHITYSMIKMISLIGKIDNQQVTGSNDSRNIKVMAQIKNQIFKIYTQELGKYTDKLKIREELVQMADKEEEFLKQNQSATHQTKQHMGARAKANKPEILIQSQESSRYDCSISHQKHSYVQQSPDSLLHEYEIKESCENQFDNDSLDRKDESSEVSDFFDFDSIQQLEIMPSGRNLLETFNNQHLCNQLQSIGKQLVHEMENSQDQMEQSIEIEPETFQVYEENLVHALKQINIDQAQLAEDQPNGSHICRKLFEEQQSSVKNANLSPINHLKSTNSQLSSAHNQNSSSILQPEHYYQVTSSQHVANESSSNYLQLAKGDTIKLLRKVDSSRWIAELQDKIGFVQESSILQRLKLIGLTAQKKHVNQVQ